MKNQILLFSLFGFALLSCKKDKTITPDFLQGKWKEEVEGFMTHTNYFYYTFKRESNECQIFILRDKYYHSTDTTIFKKYILDKDKNILTLFEGISKEENKNVEKYNVSQINSSTMYWESLVGKGNGWDRKMIKQE